MPHYDVIVVGVGAMGSAAAWQLARRGARVLALDRLSPPHALGSSHGESRIIRQSNGEGEQYVPLVLRAYEIWDEIAHLTKAPVITRCGFLLLGATSHFVTKTINAARKYGIAHEVLEASQLRSRFPQFEVNDEIGYFEPEGGFLCPELCIGSQLELARIAGADIRFGERVLEIQPALSGDGVTVVTPTSRYEGGRLIVCAGAWISELFPEFHTAFRVYRQVMYWFRPKGAIDAFLPDRFPTFIWHFATGDEYRTYGVPALNGPEGGIKIATENFIGETNPEVVDRSVHPEQAAEMYQAHVAHCFPGVSSDCVKTATCLYTVMPDHNFAIDFHPEHKQVIIASPCSGHGFKHSAAVGEILAQMALDSSTSLDISSFSLDRLQSAWQTDVRI